MRKTKLMTEKEERLGQPLEKALPELLFDHTQTEIAEMLDVSLATLAYWILKLHLRLQRVALAPDEYVEVKRRTSAP